MEACPATPVPPARILPVVHDAAPASKINAPLLAIFHGDPLLFPVIATVLSAIIPHPVAATTAPAERQSEGAPCCERTPTEKYVHPLPASIAVAPPTANTPPGRDPHQERSLFEGTRTIKHSFIFYVIFCLSLLS
jgi:hypothetical protein